MTAEQANIQDAPVLYIPLDLVGAVPGLELTEHVSFTLSPIPHGVELSGGHVTGDKIWSVPPMNVVGLYMIDERPTKKAFSITVRVMDIDELGGTAEVAHTIEYDIDPSIHGLASPPAAPEAPVGIGPSRSEIEAELKVVHERQLSALRATLAAEQNVRVAELTERLTKEANEKLADARDAWAEAEKGRFAATSETLIAKYEQKIAAETARLTAQYEAKLASSEESWKTSESERIAAQKSALERRYEAQLRDARSSAEAERSRVKDDARSSLDTEFKAKLAEAREEWRKGEVERTAAIEAKLKADAERSLQAERDRLESEIARRLEEESARWREEEAQRLTEARHTWEGQIEAAKKEAGANKVDAAAVATAVRKALAEAEAKWKSETERQLAEAREAARKDVEARIAKAEANARESVEASQSEVAAKLAAARKAFDAELAERLDAEAARLTREADKKLADAKREWEAAAARRREAFESKVREDAKAAAAELEGRLKKEFRRELLQSEAEWRAEEADRFEAAESHWRHALESARSAQAASRPIGATTGQYEGGNILRIAPRQGQTRRPVPPARNALMVIGVRGRAATG